MKTLKITFTTFLFSLVLSGFSQVINFDTNVICKSAYLPGEQTELQFTITAHSLEFNESGFAGLYYLEVQFPFGMEPISSPDATLIGDNLTLNPINSYQMSWGDLSNSGLGKGHLISNTLDFHIVLDSHVLLEDIQEVVVKMGLQYYEHPSFIQERVVQIPQYSTKDIHIGYTYLDNNNNFRVTMWNHGTETIEFFTVNYSINNGPVHSQYFEQDITADSFIVKIISLDGLLPNAGNVIIDIEIEADGDISPNTNVLQGTYEVSNSLLWDNVFNGEFGYSFPSFVLGEASNDSNEILSTDDFIIPDGESWNISQVCAFGFIFGNNLPNRFGVEIYNDNSGVPGESVHYEEISSIQNNESGMACFNLAEQVNLNSGRYWLSVYGIFDNGTDPNQDNWNWRFTEMTGEGNCFYYMSELAYSTYYEQLDWGAYLEFAEYSLSFRVYGEIANGVFAELNPKDKISIYPNPVTDNLYINLNEQFEYSIYDLSGRCVLKNKNCSYNIDVSNLSNGKYMIQITTNYRVDVF